jgi:hypothetical protein
MRDPMRDRTRAEYGPMGTSSQGRQECLPHRKTKPCCKSTYIKAGAFLTPRPITYTIFLLMTRSIRLTIVVR